jgi:hypothetical protein
MPGRPRKNPILANPFYAALLLASTLFVVTALAYLVVPYVLAPGKAAAGSSSRALAEWLDHRAPLLLAIEFVIMLLAGIVAMLTDDWFAQKSD